MKSLNILLFLLILFTYNFSQTSKPVEYETEGSHFFAISVQNLEESVKWYTNVFGLEVAKELSWNEGANQIRILKGNNLVVELISVPGIKSLEDLTPKLERDFLLKGLFKTGFFVKDAESLFNKLKEKEVSFRGEIFIEEELNQKSFIVLDNNGNRIQIFQKLKPVNTEN